MVTGTTTMSDLNIIHETEYKNSIDGSAKKVNQPSRKRDFLVTKIINYRVKDKCRLHPISSSYRHLDLPNYDVVSRPSGKIISCSLNRRRERVADCTD